MAVGGGAADTAVDSNAIETKRGRLPRAENLAGQTTFPVAFRERSVDDELLLAILHDPRVSSGVRKRSKAPPAAAEAASLATSMYDREPSMITSDPPEHDRVRRATMRHFGPPHTPDLVSSQEDGIKRIVTDLLDKLKGKTRIDVVDEFAYPLPVSVICRVLGVPEED